MMTIAELIAEQSALEAAREKRRKEFEALERATAGRLGLIASLREAHLEGLDIGRIQRANELIHIEGTCTGTERRQATEDAVRDIAEGPRKLREEYVGVKNYAGFGDQREDHRYGYGPRHGSIVFRIELSREARSREWTPEEKDAAIYTLGLLAKGENVEKILVTR